jgi:hypothetical protein
MKSPSVFSQCSVKVSACLFSCLYVDINLIQCIPIARFGESAYIYALCVSRAFMFLSSFMILCISMIMTS